MSLSTECCSGSFISQWNVNIICCLHVQFTTSVSHDITLQCAAVVAGDWRQPSIPPPVSPSHCLLSHLLPSPSCWSACFSLYTIIILALDTWALETTSLCGGQLFQICYQTFTVLPDHDKSRSGCGGQESLSTNKKKLILIKAVRGLLLTFLSLPTGELISNELQEIVKSGRTEMAFGNNVCKYYENPKFVLSTAAIKRFFTVFASPSISFVSHSILLLSRYPVCPLQRSFRWLYSSRSSFLTFFTFIFTYSVTYSRSGRRLSI